MQGPPRQTFIKFYLIEFFRNFYFISGVLVPFYLDWGQISLAQTLTLQAWFMAWIMVLEIPSGAIADRFGRKITVMMGLGANIIGILIYTSFPLFGIFLVGEFFWALSEALVSGAYEALLYDSLKERGEEHRFKEIFSRMTSIGLVGIGVAAPLGSVIAVLWGLRETMLFMVVPIGIALGISFTVQEHRLQNETKESNNPQEGKSKDSYLQTLRTGFRNYHTNHDLRRLAWDMLAIATASYFIIWTYQILLTRVSVPLAYFGLVHLGMLLVQVVVLNIFPRIEKRLKRKKFLLQITASCVGIGFLVCAIFEQIPLVIFGILLTAAFGLSRAPLMADHFNRKIPSEQRATMLSIVNMFKRLTLMVLNPFMGLFFEQSLPLALGLLGICVIIWSIITPLREKYLTQLT